MDIFKKSFTEKSNISIGHYKRQGKGHNKRHKMESNNKDKSSNNDLKAWQSFGLLRSEGQLEFVFKKTEKIAAALYLVTSIIKDNDPLRFQLREKAMNLVNAGIVLTRQDAVDHGSIFAEIAVSLFEINSLLRVAFLAGVISPMNYKVLAKEVLFVVSLLGEKNKDEINQAGYVLADSFFETGEIVSNIPPAVAPNVPKTMGSIPGPAAVPPIKSPLNTAASSASNIDKGHKKPLENIASVKDKKNSRKILIINLLKKESKLTIKDFVKVIPDCSEKTIQRELLDLVIQGVLKKEGERRWSTYSLRD